MYSGRLGLDNYKRCLTHSEDYGPNQRRKMEDRGTLDVQTQPGESADTKRPTHGSTKLFPIHYDSIGGTESKYVIKTFKIKL